MGTTPVALTIQSPYDECQIINQLQAYNTWPPNDEQLDLMREIQYSGNYYWQGLAIPNTTNRSFAAYVTQNGTAIVPPGSYVTGITSYASQGEAAAGSVGTFKFKLVDKSTKASIFYGDYAYSKIVSSEMQIGTIYDAVPTDQGSNQDTPFGTSLLMSPFIITGSGVLTWEIVNLAPVANVIQLLLSVAVPIGLRSIGQVVVSKGY
jgi:hypothetical protein